MKIKRVGFKPLCTLWMCITGPLDFPVLLWINFCSFVLKFLCFLCKVYIWNKMHFYVQGKGKVKTIAQGSPGADRGEHKHLSRRKRQCLGPSQAPCLQEKKRAYPCLCQNKGVHAVGTPFKSATALGHILVVPILTLDSSWSYSAFALDETVGKLVCCRGWLRVCVLPMTTIRTTSPNL